jgi:predicted DNA-binding WGR domain protein
MALAHLHRIDPEANMARFYCIDVAATLFGDVSVLRTWGRIGTHGRTSIETCATVEDAERAASRTLRQKMRRGYRDAAPTCGRLRTIPPVTVGRHQGDS